MVYGCHCALIATAQFEPGAVIAEIDPGINAHAGIFVVQQIMPIQDALRVLILSEFTSHAQSFKMHHQFASGLHTFPMAPRTQWLIQHDHLIKTLGQFDQITPGQIHHCGMVISQFQGHEICLIYESMIDGLILLRKVAHSLMCAAVIVA
jgi:hypothetical protein